MAEEPENQTLRYLCRINQKVDRIVEDVHDLKVRMTGLEERLAGVNRRLDRVGDRLDKVETRLDLVENTFGGVAR